MRSEPHDGPREPSAARRLHPLTLIFAALRIGRAMIVPALAAIFGAGQDDFQRRIALGLGILAGPALAAAIGRYLSFRFRLTDAELIVDSGVLQRRRRLIPLDRIQNVDVRQSWLQRLSGVAELRVETAGGRQTEAVLEVLGRAEADALRRELLRRGRGAAAPAPPPPNGTAPASLPPPAAEVLARLSPGELALAGATANEVGLVAAALAGLLQLLDDAVERLQFVSFDPGALVPGLPPAAGVALALAAFLLLIVLVGWLVSVAAAVVGYHDFTLERAGTELRKRYGLLDRREASLPLGRVQALRIEETLLRRPLGLAALRIETAGGAPGRGRRGGAEAFLPLTRHAEVGRLAAAVFGDLDYDALRFQPVHRRARQRLFLRLSAPVAVAAAAGAWGGTTGWPALLLLLLPAWLLADRLYRNRGIAAVPGYVATRAGFFNRITWIVPERKIQALHLVQTPFQRRQGLATLVVDTAGSREEARVADLGTREAEALLDALAGRLGGTEGRGAGERAGGVPAAG